jgi:hypothetical protein
MLGVYAGLALVPLAVWRWRRRPETYVIVGVCLGFLVAYGLVVPNVGALYRMRYAFLMTLVGLGLAGGLARRPDRPPGGPPVGGAGEARGARGWRDGDPGEHRYELVLGEQVYATFYVAEEAFPDGGLIRRAEAVKALRG